MLPRPSGIVTLLTDFGTRDPYVGVMRGVVLRHNPKVVLCDLGHEVPAHDVGAGAFWLLAAVGRFPSGTVHTAVIDPGVGTARRLLAAAAHEAYWIAPDNGLLSYVVAGDPLAEVRAIDLEHLNVRPPSRTFHGRDVMAPVAGWLSGGRYGFSALGPRVTDPVALPGLQGGGVQGGGVHGGAPRIVHVDGFGNLITNVSASSCEGCTTVVVGGREVPIRQTYADVPLGSLLALVGSYGLLEIAVNCGSAAKVLGVGREALVEVRAARSGASS